MYEPLPLSIREVTKRFRHKNKQRQPKAEGHRGQTITAVSSVSVDLKKGEIYGLLGPNGCGKSTLVRIVATLVLPDEGTVTVFGRDVVKEAAVVRRMINRVSVEASFFKKLSTTENLVYAARLYGLDPGHAAQRAEEILGRLGFPRERIHESVENLSRGQQQKIAIARGLLTSPVLLLLDEPTTGLDPTSKRDVQTFVRSVVESHDASVLFTTHDMEEADRLCDRIGIMNEGKIIAEGRSEELKDRVRTERLPEPTLEDVFMHMTGASLQSEEG